MNTHTPTPWNRSGAKIVRHIAGNTDPIGEAYGSIYDEDEGPSNAAFIVRACNNHEALVNALKLVIEAENDLGIDLCAALNNARELLAAIDKEGAS